MGEPLLCQNCKEGQLHWIGEIPDEGEITNELKCNKCGFTYHGMKDFIENGMETKPKEKLKFVWNKYKSWGSDNYGTGIETPLGTIGAKIWMYEESDDEGNTIEPIKKRYGCLIEMENCCNALARLDSENIDETDLELLKTKAEAYMMNVLRETKKQLNEMEL
jgi:hypothetical protein